MMGFVVLSITRSMLMPVDSAKADGNVAMIFERSTENIVPSSSDSVGSGHTTAYNG
jgi:hypothetical protein